MHIELPTYLYRQTRNRHLTVWLLITLYYAFFSSVQGSTLVRATWICMLILNYSFSFYALLLLIWPKILRGRNILWILGLICVIVIFFLIYYFQLKILIPWIGGYHYMADQPFNSIFKNALTIFLYVFFSSLGSYFNWAGIKKIEEDINIDKAIVKKEFNFLKSQFHSHLTFNFLNFCYNRIKRDSPQTAVSVEEFSDMLRYSLTSPIDELVLLKKEIEYIETCVSFQKCLTNDLNIQFSCEENIRNVYLVPRMFVVFVENSFKHGVLHDPQNPITISIRSTSNEIIFIIKNKKNNQKTSIESGIGIRNIVQILELFYPKKHLLLLNDDSTFFSCELRLQYN